MVHIGKAAPMQITASKPLTYPRLPVGLLERLIKGLMPQGPRNTPNADRARRDFVNETLRANPQAFGSDHDVAAMMHHFPERF